METIHTQTMWSRVGQAVGQAWQSSKTKIVNIFPSWETIKITSASLKTRAVEFGGKAVNLLPSVVKNHPVVTISLVIAGGISTLYLLHKRTKNKIELLEAENQKLQKQIQDDKFDLIGTKNTLRGKDEELRDTSALLQATQIMLQSTRYQLTEAQDALNEMRSQDGSQESQTSSSSNDIQETQSGAQKNSLSSENENQVNIQETQSISQSDTQEIQDENQVDAQENDIQAQNEVEQPVKRGRGRPKKDQNEDNLQLKSPRHSMVTRSQAKKSSTESE